MARLTGGFSRNSWTNSSEQAWMSSVERPWPSFWERSGPRSPSSSEPIAPTSWQATRSSWATRSASEPPPSFSRASIGSLHARSAGPRLEEWAGLAARLVRSVETRDARHYPELWPEPVQSRRRSTHATTAEPAPGPARPRSRPAMWAQWIVRSRRLLRNARTSGRSCSDRYVGGPPRRSSAGTRSP